MRLMIYLISIKKILHKGLFLFLGQHRTGRAVKMTLTYIRSNLLETRNVKFIDIIKIVYSDKSDAEDHKAPVDGPEGPNKRALPYAGARIKCHQRCLIP